MTKMNALKRVVPTQTYNHRLLGGGHADYESLLKAVQAIVEDRSLVAMNAAVAKDDPMAKFLGE